MFEVVQPIDQIIEANIAQHKRSKQENKYFDFKTENRNRKPRNKDRPSWHSCKKRP